MTENIARKVSVYIRCGTTGAPLGTYHYVAVTAAEAARYALHQLEKDVEATFLSTDVLPTQYIIRMEVTRD